MITNRQIIGIIETNEYYKNLLIMLSTQKVIGESLIDDTVINNAKVQRKQLMEQYNQWLDSEAL